MYAVVYRWRLRPGMEEQFVDGWTRVTAAILQSCGSYGSRLHKCDDGTWLAYARWPSADVRDACDHDETVGRQLMADAIETSYDEIRTEIVTDLLAEPS